MAKDIIIDENRGFKGVWIPKNLYTCTELTPNEKFLLLEIYSLSKRNVCYANNKHFADFTGLKENTVQKSFLKFEKMGYLNRIYEYKDGTKEIKCRKLILTKRFYNELMNESVDDVVEKNPQGGGLKFGDKYNNNKYNNNKNYSVTSPHDSDCDNEILIKAKSITNDNTILVAIDYYLKKYKTELGRDHPDITYASLSNIISNLISVLDEADNEIITDNGLAKMINRHFDTNYGQAIDYKLQHFGSEGILEYQARNCGYICGINE